MVLLFGLNYGIRLVFRPIDHAIFKSLQVDFGDRWSLVNKSCLGITTPVISRSDDDAMAKWSLAGGGEEAVNVALLQTIGFVVTFALNGMILVGRTGFGYQVDSDIFSILTIDLGPITIHPDIAVEVGIGGFVGQICSDQFFEIGTFLSL